MPRPSKPWYKPSHRAWYCRIDGKLIRLGTEKREAERLFHRLMAEKGRGGPLATSKRTLEWLADTWMDDAKGRVKPATWKGYKALAENLVKSLGRVLVSDLEPRHVARWLADNPDWESTSTRFLAVSVAKIISAWGAAHPKLTGMTADPWASVKRPPMLARKPAKLEELERIIIHIPSEPYKQFLAVLLETGCRPGELRTLEAKDIDWGAGTALVRGKRGERVVYLSPIALGILEAWSLKYPVGPVLRNTFGKPWTQRATQDHLERAREASGVTITPYQIRGLFASLALRRGVDSLLVAKLMGHADLKMLRKHYADVEADQLRQAVRIATGDASAAPPAPATSPPGTTPDNGRDPRP